MADPNPWEAARALQVIRGNSTLPPRPIDPGVNFFVLMLEQLGARTIDTCEGHPDGFYIVFCGPYELARRIARLDNFDVKLQEDNWFHLSLDFAYRRDGGIATWTDERRVAWLAGAAEDWTREFGPLKALEALPATQPADQPVSTPQPPVDENEALPDPLKAALFAAVLAHITGAEPPAPVIRSFLLGRGPSSPDEPYLADWIGQQVMPFWFAPDGVAEAALFLARSSLELAQSLEEDAALDEDDHPWYDPTMDDKVEHWLKLLTDAPAAAPAS